MITKFDMEHSIYESKPCGALKADGGRCRKRTARDHKCWMHGIKEKKVKVCPSTLGANVGLGLFARASVRGVDPEKVVFEKGDSVCTYQGEILTRDQVNRRYPGDAIATYALEIGRDKFIDARKTTSCYGRYANARYRTNVEMGNPAGKNGNYVNLVAKRPIKDGQEIFVRYGRPGEVRWNRNDFYGPVVR